VGDLWSEEVDEDEGETGPDGADEGEDAATHGDS
jgi:hypothetical protein